MFKKSRHKESGKPKGQEAYREAYKYASLKFSITDKELELLVALERHGRLKDAARALGIKPSTARQRLARLKLRYQLARELCRDFERWRMRIPRYLEA